LFARFAPSYQIVCPCSFQSIFQGHRLGAAHETETITERIIPSSAAVTSKRKTNTTNGNNIKNTDECLPAPIVDPTLTDEERERQRQTRLAAAAARQKKQGGPPKKEKKSTAPLTGPNSEPLMRWTA
jgi:hypothetical protein